MTVRLLLPKFLCLVLYKTKHVEYFIKIVEQAKNEMIAPEIQKLESVEQLSELLINFESPRFQYNAFLGGFITTSFYYPCMIGQSFDLRFSSENFKNLFNTHISFNQISVK